MDIEHIRDLVELMVANDLSRVEIKEGDRHILLRRGHAPVMSALPAHSHAPLVMPSGRLSGGRSPSRLSGWSEWQDLNLRPPRPE